LIKLHTNSSYKKLYINLLQLLIEGNSVFAKTWIVIPNHSAKQWLQKSLAKSLGVCAQIQFILPLSFNWEILKNVAESNGNINVYSSDVMRWQIYQLINNSQEFAVLKKESSLENFNLSEKIAQTLLKYSEERPELINNWDKGIFQLKKEQEWQADMWIKLLSILKEKSPVQLLQQFNPATDFKQKPNKIILFATEQLTTIQKDTLLKLAEHQDIHLYLSNPCPNEYWFDIKPSAALARDRLFNTELAYLDNVGNSLLANLGYNKMAIFDAFLSHDIDVNIANQIKKSESLLGSVRQDIFELSENPQVYAVDDSITIHSCHNRLREVEIIKDEMLFALDKDKTLNPEDIIVVAPDINEYVYAIKQVFNNTDEEQNTQIPFHIDRVQLADNNYITALMHLLNSFTGEMSATVIYELLSQAVILEKFKMTEDDLPRIKSWIVASNIRNFYSIAHKNELDFEKKIGNTWHFGENRWLSGYLAGDVEDTPYLSTFGDITGQEALFSQCFYFLKLWYQFYKQSKKQQSPQQWYAFIKDICSEFLYNDFETDFEKQISQQLENKFIQQPLNCQPKIPITIINAIVEAVITENNYRSEGLIGVRFQTWENAFIVDAKVLIVMGLNDGEFPQKQSKNDLDIFNNISPRLNKSTRQRDKNLMLTALTENVEQLIISYIGFDPKNNDPQPPSVLVADLLNYLQIKTGNTFKVKSHKMHGYNKAYFSDGSSSYSQKNHLLAQSYYNSKETPKQTEIDLKLDHENTISLNDLCKFFTDPLDFFLKKRAQINHPIYEDILQDTETYYPDGLESWALKNQIFSHGKSSAAKTGIISDNKSGQLLLKKYDNELSLLLNYAEETDLKTHIIELSISDFKIFGSIKIDKNQQLISIYPGKASSKNICKHWIKHLCYPVKQASIIHFEDKIIKFEPLTNSDKLLQALLEKWQQSFNRPWLFCPASFIKIYTKSLSLKTKKEYLGQFIENKNSFPSEGQKYFIKQVEEYNEENDLKQFLPALIDNTTML
jgi:exodeoxyribonuclease V gamma subunit